MKWQRFISIVKKEFIQLKRDKASFGIAIMMPIMMILLFGYAVNTQLKDVSLTISDYSNTEQSKEIIENFKADDYFKVALESKSEEALKEEMDKGKLNAALIIPEDFNKNLELKYMVDGSNPTTAKTAQAKGEIIIQLYNKKVLDKMQGKLPKATNIAKTQIKSQILYNEDLKNENFTIPGLIGLILQNVTVLLTAFAMVRERERGTIEQLVVSPLKSSEIILGKLVPYILIGFLDFLFALGLGLGIFKVNINGSLILLMPLGLLFVICSLAIGLLISTISKTQLQAMQLSFLIILPSVLLSGFVFPREAMPKAIQLIGNVLPLTYFLNIIRGIITKGIGIAYLSSDIILLSILSFVILLLSIFRYRRKAF